MTYYNMRYEKRKLPEEEARIIFNDAEYIVVSTVDEDGMPYGVPLSFVLIDDSLYIHATNTFGHKLENFKRDDRVCATAVSSADPCFEQTFFTTRYESAIVFGHIREVTDPVEFKKALVELCMKYVPEFKAEIGAAIEREIDQTAVWSIDIEEISGKASRKIGDWTPGE